MPRKRHTPEQIISKLREAEVGLAGGQTVPEVCRTLGVAEGIQLSWRWNDGTISPILDVILRMSDRHNRITPPGEAMRHGM